MQLLADLVAIVTGHVLGHPWLFWPFAVVAIVAAVVLATDAL